MNEIDRYTKILREQPVVTEEELKELERKEKLEKQMKALYAAGAGIYGFPI